jgi:hypothetical protein
LAVGAAKAVAMPGVSNRVFLVSGKMLWLWEGFRTAGELHAGSKRRIERLGKKNYRLFHFILILLILYVPFHVLEEYLGYFPVWLAMHYGLPKAPSYAHWLINNGIFFSCLLISFFIYKFNGEKFKSLGFGLIIWFFMNSLEHIGFTITDHAASPGLISATFFFGVSVLATRMVLVNKEITLKQIGWAVPFGLLNWVVPIVIIVSVGTWLQRLLP